MFRTAIILWVLATPLSSPAVAQSAGSGADREAVTRAALDYLDGFYQGDSAIFARSVRPDVAKLGFWRPRDSTRYQAPERMTWGEAIDYIRKVKSQKHFAPATAPKQVTVLDLLDQTAAVKVTAWWGTDYLLLGKFDGRWMISHVLWQSPPPAA
jgi:hypothetical protein